MNYFLLSLYWFLWQILCVLTIWLTFKLCQSWSKERHWPTPVSITHAWTKDDQYIQSLNTPVLQMLKFPQKWRFFKNELTLIYQRVTKSVLEVNFSQYQSVNQWEMVWSDIYWTNTNLFPPKINNINIFSKPCKVRYRSRCRKHVRSDLILSIVNWLDCWIVVISRLMEGRDY